MSRDLIGLRSLVILLLAACAAYVASIDGGAAGAITVGLLVAATLHALVGK